MTQYMYSYYTNSTKTNVISVCVWTFSKEVKLVQCISCSFHCSWNFSSLIDVFQSMLVMFTSISWVFQIVAAIFISTSRGAMHT